MHNNFIDDFMNSLDVVALRSNSKGEIQDKVAIIINNQYKYLAYTLSDDHLPKLKKSEELKLKILSDFYGWKIINVDLDKTNEIAENLKAMFA